MSAPGQLDEPLPVLIVGGGFSGATAAVQLVRRSPMALSITVIEPRPRVGPGLAYSATDPDHRLNGPVLTHAIDPEDPTDLLNWCQRTGTLQRDPEAFSATGKPYVRRGDFGHYLADAVQAHADWPATGSRIRHEQAQAVGASREADTVRVALDNGRTLQGRLLVVATGNPRPRLRAPFDSALAGHPRVWGDPLDPAHPLQLPAHAAVLLVGSGLTALDMMASLLRQGHRGSIDVVSRRGLRPRPQAPDLELPPGAPLPRILDAINAELPDWLRAACHTPTARGWTRALRARIRTGLARGETWHAGFDELRNGVWRAWPLLPPAEQRRFLRQLRTWYDMHRFRTPPMTDARVQQAQARGQVRLHAARVQRVWAGPEDRLLVQWTDAQGPQTRAFDAVVNCTGLDAAAQVADNPLLASLQDQGLLQVDAAGIGFAVDAQGCAIRPDGHADPGLRVIGPPTAGTFGDPLGAMFIAAQVHRMLPHWLQTLAGDG